MKILIVGGAGFIGINLAELLVNSHPKDHVIVLDNQSSNSSNPIDHLEKRRNFTFIKGSIANQRLVNRIIKEHQPEVIINTISPRQSIEIANSIIIGTNLLLDSICKHHHNLIRYLFLSDDEVYGDTITESGNMQNATEKNPLDPRTPHAAAITAADLLTTAYFHRFQLPTLVLRISNVYGPRQSTERLLPKLIKFALNNESIPIYGDGTHMRDWINVQDIVNLLENIIYRNDSTALDLVYNVSSETPLSILETVELILTILNKPKELITFEQNQSPGSIRKVLDSTNVKKALDWQPQIDFKHGLKETIEWYQNHG